MNPTLKLSSLLLLYLVIILSHSFNTFEGDEGRYLWFAENLSRGYYSPPGSIDLASGPGYAFVLLPVVLLKLPLLAARLPNALFLFLGVLYFFSALRLYMRQQLAIRFSYLFGLYPIFLKHLHLILTESLTVFLICGFLYHFCKAFRSEEGNLNQRLLASTYLSYLALTKVFFGYVIFFGLLFFLILSLWKKITAIRKISWVYAVALLGCVPYLVYTYSLTGKVFYWSTYGGSSLYWMSTPFETELGDWKGNGLQHLQDFNVPSLTQNHGEFFREISPLNSVEWDARLKAKALSNIYHSPKKFVKNWICNVGRLLFQYPFSYTPQQMSTLFHIFPNMFIVVFSILCVYPTYLGRKKIPIEILALLFFGVVAFGGSSLLSAYERHFEVLVPIFALWIFYVLTQVLKIEIRP